MNENFELGDYQTPVCFAEKVCGILKDFYQISPDVIIEPTCGEGHFIEACRMFHAKKIYGIEIQRGYYEHCVSRFQNPGICLIHEDFFSMTQFPEQDNFHEEILLIGNPPWVTNSAMSAFGKTNLPVKSNVKKAKGLEAITGGGNFDICESIILKLIESYPKEKTMLAMLCKTVVAKNVFQELVRRNIGFSVCENILFDSKKIFSVNVDACLFVIRFSGGEKNIGRCNIREMDHLSEIVSVYGYKNGLFYSNLRTNADDFDGQCCFSWRQGIKHDCAKIMELSRANSVFKNGFGFPVDVEDGYLYPLIKSSAIKNEMIHIFDKYVLVTQKFIREDTSAIKEKAPRTWNYLQQNRQWFESRKSCIYHNSPVFSIFGVGDYSFAKYKVAVSGFNKKPQFALVYSEDSRPVMLDDTAYFISFDSFENAYTAMLLLNMPAVKNFILHIAFTDSKRPFTKKVLSRIDFSKILRKIPYSSVVSLEKQLLRKQILTEQIYGNFARHVRAHTKENEPVS